MTTTTCRGPGSRWAVNATSRTRIPCTCGTYHDPVAVQQAAREPGRSVAAIEAELAKPGNEGLMVVKDTITGSERRFLAPTPPVVPERPTTLAERMGRPHTK